MSTARPHRVDPPSTAVPRRTEVSRRAGPHLADGERRSNGPDPQSDASRIPTAGGTSHRVDRSHAAQSCDTASRDTVSRDTDSRDEAPIHVARRQDWLRLHGTDLVDRLQAWATDLDAREAQLNARSSLQDHRERRFRLHQQDVATELAEQQRSIGRLRNELEAQARRLAFLSEQRSE